MEKVKLTQEQAEIIEEVKDYKKKYQKYISDMLYERCINGSWIGTYEPLNNINADEFARAIYIGYEVEPEFKVGDWVKSKFGKGIGKIIRIYEMGYRTDSGMLADTDDIRHATEEEIAEEKERRFWAKHGRDVGEYRTGDILKNRFGFLREVHDIKKEYNGDGVIQLAPNYTLFSRDDIAGGFSVVTFAEDRKDVKE